MRQKFFSTLLIFIALATGLFLSEFLVRAFFPRYQYAATQALKYEENRLVARVPHQNLSFPHPDGLEKIEIHFNSEALRGPEIDWQSSKEFWGFFGDSFVENLRISYPQTFTALINQQRSENLIAVNFGVEGYGTDQAFLYYRHFPNRKKIKKVFYFFCHNDLRDLKNNQLFDLTDSGELTSVLVREISFLKRWLGKWHLTYLGLEVYQRLQGRSLDRFVGENPEMQMVTLLGENHFQKRFELMGQGDWRLIDQKTIKIFHKILEQWKILALRNGASFHLVILPDLDSDQLAHELGLAEQSETLFLRPYFLEKFEKEDRWTFDNDYHWHEEANEFLASLLLQLIPL